jgi:hypothetical protein
MIRRLLVVSVSNACSLLGAGIMGSACLVLSMGAAVARGSDVTVYSAPEGSPVSRDYTVTVEGKPVDIYRRGYGAFSILPLHGTEIRNITFNNIRLEYIKGQLFCFKFGEKLYGRGIPGDHSYPGTIADVTIRNVSVTHQGGGRRSQFAGWSNDKQVRNVTIDGLRYGKTLVRDRKGMGLRCNEHVSGIHFVDGQKRNTSE